MSEPATRDDLEQATTQLRGEMGAMGEQLRGEMRTMGEQLRGEMRVMGEQLRGEMGAMGEQLRGEMGQLRAEMGQLRDEMAAMETRLNRSIGEGMQRVANVIMEHMRGQVAAFDEKYQGLPGRHTELRADFSAHASDLRLHKRPTTPAKRARRPRSR